MCRRVPVANTRAAVLESFEPKRRVNVCLYPETLRRMSEYCDDLGCSRSELLEYCFRFWESQYEQSRKYEGVVSDASL